MLLLANLSNNISNGVQDIGTGVAATGPLDETDAASGPRSEIVKWSPAADTAGAGLHFTYDTDEWEVDYLIVCRCDWMLTEANVQYKITQESSAGSITDHTTWTTFSSPTLYGPRDQDFVLSITTTSGQRYGNGVAFRNSGGSAATYYTSDVVFAKAYDIGEPNKQPAPTFNYLPPDDQDFIPYEGYFSYATEKQITLSWPILNRAEVTTFETFLFVARPLRVPCFLWDSTADLFPHYLEHVLIERYQLQQLPTGDHYSLNVTFRRLKHYL